LKKIRLATRRSPLALWQTRFVAEKLRAVTPGLETELIELSTRGDQILDRPLAEIGGKGLFLKELEVAMLENQADIAVHSLKDVPAEMPDGLELSAVLDRHNPLDALVSNQYNDLRSLPKGAVVGTSSLRRQAQLLANRPDLDIRSLRGNVNTRLSKLDAGDFDAIILAAAGLERLGMAQRIAQLLSPEDCLPAASQGVIGIEARQGDEQVRTLVQALHHAQTEQQIKAERQVSRELGGSCRVPLAAFARVEHNRLALTAIVANADGTKLLKVEVSGDADHSEALGSNAAALLR